MDNIDTNGSMDSAKESILNNILCDESLLTKTRSGMKAGTQTGWKEPANLLTPEEAQQWAKDGGNIGIRLGLDRGDEPTFVVLDVEEEGALSDEVGELINEYTLTVWKSPHSGLNRLLTVTSEAYVLMEPFHQRKLDLDGDGDHEMELLTKNHALIPPSEIDHRECDDGKNGCPGVGCDPYWLVDTNPKANALTEEVASSMLDELDLDSDKGRTTTDGDINNFALPEVDNELADEGEVALRTLQEEAAPAFNSLVDLLRGGTGGYDDLLRGDGGIDRSLQELMALTRLHEVVVYLADKDGDQAEAITRSTFERYVCNHRTTSNGQVRRWVEDSREDYHRDRLCRAIKACDRGAFERFLHRDPTTDEQDRWTDVYSWITRELVHFALDLLAGELEKFYDDADDLREWAAVGYRLDLDRAILEELLANPPAPVQDTTRGVSGYVSADNRPTKGEVIEMARTLDAEHNERATYETALRRLRYDGLAAMACMKKGVDYCYYPARFPDPSEAEYVRTGGEMYESKRSATQRHGHIEADKSV
jgi:hypothetical protein